LSRSSSPFCSCYSGERVLLFAQVALDCDRTIYAFHYLWDNRHMSLHPERVSPFCPLPPVVENTHSLSSSWAVEPKIALCSIYCEQAVTLLAALR
jgi:hypothetical protein